MAFILKDGTYIKVLGNGNWEMYPSKEFRDRMKSAPKYDEVITKYAELRESAYNALMTYATENHYEEDLARYDLEDFGNLHVDAKSLTDRLMAIDEETNRYVRRYPMNCGLCEEKFPIVQEYFDIPVEYGIPYILSTGYSRPYPLKDEIYDVEQTYRLFKKYELFEEAEDDIEESTIVDDLLNGAS